MMILFVIGFKSKYSMFDQFEKSSDYKRDF